MYIFNYNFFSIFLLVLSFWTTDCIFQELRDHDYFNRKLMLFHFLTCFAHGKSHWLWCNITFSIKCVSPLKNIYIYTFEIWRDLVLIFNSIKCHTNMFWILLIFSSTRSILCTFWTRYYFKFRTDCSSYIISKYFDFRMKSFKLQFSRCS